MSKIRRVDFSPDEWIAGTRELTMEERGAYWDICALQYSRGGPIADDDAWISRTLGCHVRTWRTIKTRLVTVGKLTIEGGQLVNGRVERELKKAQGRLKQSRDAAEESAKQRRERAENAAQSNDYNDIPEAAASAADEAIQQPATINLSYESKEEVTAAESVTTGALAESGSPQPKREPRGTRLPDDWRPDENLRQWTIVSIRDASSGVSAGHELGRFKDHWKAQIGARGRKADWSATWRNWIRKAIELEAKANGSHRNGHARGVAVTQEDHTLAGVGQSLARRHLLPRG